MSLKPPKKSDLGKGWMKPRRNSRKMVVPEYHLIVSEGTATEPLYFQSIKETIDDCYRDRIHLNISGKGCSTLVVVKRFCNMSVQSTYVEYLASNGVRYPL